MIQRSGVCIKRRSYAPCSHAQGWRAAFLFPFAGWDVGLHWLLAGGGAMCEHGRWLPGQRDGCEATAMLLRRVLLGFPPSFISGTIHFLCHSSWLLVVRLIAVHNAMHMLLCSSTLVAG